MIHFMQLLPKEYTFLLVTCSSVPRINIPNICKQGLIPELPTLTLKDITVWVKKWIDYKFKK